MSGPATYSQTSGNNAVQSYGATVTQTLLNGFGTSSRTRQAEQLVSAAQETLRLTEQTTLLNAATAYMNLIRDAAILDLQRRNVEVLQEQLPPDPRSLQRRRSHAHRRGAIGIAAGCRPRLDADRRIQLHDLAAQSIGR